MLSSRLSSAATFSRYLASATENIGDESRTNSSALGSSSTLRNMSAIKCEIFLDPRHLPKHLPNTPQVQRLFRRGQAAHVFNGEETIFRVSQAIIKRGEYIGNIRNYERYGLLFSEQIGSRIYPNGSRVSLFYREVIIDANNRYHPIPGTRPSEG